MHTLRLTLKEKIVYLNKRQEQ